MLKPTPNLTVTDPPAPAARSRLCMKSLGPLFRFNFHMRYELLTRTCGSRKLNDFPKDTRLDRNLWIQGLHRLIRLHSWCSLQWHSAISVPQRTDRCTRKEKTVLCYQANSGNNTLIPPLTLAGQQCLLCLWNFPFYRQMILIKLGFTFGGSDLLFFSEEENNVFKMMTDTNIFKIQTIHNIWHLFLIRRRKSQRVFISNTMEKLIGYSSHGAQSYVS